MIYHGDSSPQDQAADHAMTALYQQLDDHDLPADTPFNTAAGHRDLTYRIGADVASDGITAQLDAARTSEGKQAEVARLRGGQSHRSLNGDRLRAAQDRLPGGPVT